MRCDFSIKCLFLEIVCLITQEIVQINYIPVFVGYDNFSALPCVL